MTDRDKPPRDGDKPPRPSSVKSSSGGFGRLVAGRRHRWIGRRARASGGRRGGSWLKPGPPDRVSFIQLVVPRVVRLVVGHWGHGRPEANPHGAQSQGQPYRGPHRDDLGRGGLGRDTSSRIRDAATPRDRLGYDRPADDRPRGPRPSGYAPRTSGYGSRPPGNRPPGNPPDTGRRAIGPVAGRRDWDVLIQGFDSLALRLYGKRPPAYGLWLLAYGERHRRRSPPVDLRRSIPAAIRPPAWSMVRPTHAL